MIFWISIHIRHFESLWLIYSHYFAFLILVTQTENLLNLNWEITLILDELNLDSLHPKPYISILIYVVWFSHLKILFKISLHCLSDWVLCSSLSKLIFDYHLLSFWPFVIVRSDLKLHVCICLIWNYQWPSGVMI